MTSIKLIFLYCWAITTVVNAQITSTNWQSDLALLGYSGSIVIPSAYLSADKTLHFGGTHFPQKVAFQAYSEQKQSDSRMLFANLSFLPFMEVTFGLNKVYNAKDLGLGDRVIFTRFQLLKERKHVPAILIGFHDTFTRSSFVNTNYLVVSKRISLPKDWVVHTHLGYGFKFKEATAHYLLGAFGGVNLKWKFLGAAVEYDADRMNAALEANIKNRVFLKTALLDKKYFSASVNIRFRL